MSTRRKAMLAALAVVVVGGGVIWFTTGNDPERAGPPLTAPTGAAKPSTSSTPAKAKPKTTPTTKATTTPTNEVSEPGESGQQPAQTAEAVGPRSNPGPFQVATAKVPSVEAQLAAPTGVEAKPAVTTGRPAFAGNQQGAQPLPRIEQPVEGRFATATGYRFENPQPFGDALTFLVVQRSGDWVQVQLPVRPNGTTAWVRASDVTLGEVPGHVEVNLAQRTLRVFEGSTLTAETPVAVGVDATRTPTGRHFITDKLDEPAGASRYPWSLGISAYSEQLDTFDGGAPQIAMHGWRDASVFGKAKSNGCIRVPTDVVNQLAAMPLGTPVDVYPS